MFTFGFADSLIAWVPFASVLIGFFYSFSGFYALFFKMDFDDSSSDSRDFAGFNLSNIEVHKVDYESELDISDISVSRVGPSGDAHGWFSY